MLFSIVFSVDIPNSNDLGDIILKKIGLKPWSSDTGGFHNTVLYALAMFIIGYIGVTRCLKDIYPRFTKSLPLILMLVLFIMPSALSLTNTTIKSMSNGINAIDYNRKLSSCDYSVDNAGTFEMSANLQFHNYSSKNVTFYIKYKPYQSITEDVINEEYLTATGSDSDEPQAYTIPPKSTSDLLVYFNPTLKSNVTSLQGSASQLDIIIYTENEEKSFIKEY